MSERRCPSCKKYYIFDPDVDLLDRGCPNCNDPSRLTGCTYRKRSIISRTYKALSLQGIPTNRNDETLILELMQLLYPAVRNYYDNLRYSTFTLKPGTPLLTNENFVLGDVIYSPKSGVGIRRQIICLRCANIPELTHTQCLSYFLGLKVKRCIHCDRWHKPKTGETMLDRAKRLNVSLMDYRRGNLTSQPGLAPGETLKNGLTVVKTWYDETRDVYQPKYELQCPKCSFNAITQQRGAERIKHRCQPND